MYGPLHKGVDATLPSEVQSLGFDVPNTEKLKVRNGSHTRDSKTQNIEVDFFKPKASLSYTMSSVFTWNSE